MPIPNRSHQTASLLKLNKAWADAKGTPLSPRILAGYYILTSGNLRDGLILFRATRPELTILGPNLKASPGTEHAFRAACATSQVLELGEEFSTLEPGQAASGLLEKIRALDNTGHSRPASSA